MAQLSPLLHFQLPPSTLLLAQCVATHPALHLLRWVGAVAPVLSFILGPRAPADISLNPVGCTIARSLVGSLGVAFFLLGILGLLARIAGITQLRDFLLYLIFVILGSKICFPSLGFRSNQFGILIILMPLDVIRCFDCNTSTRGTLQAYFSRSCLSCSTFAHLLVAGASGGGDYRLLGTAAGHPCLKLCSPRH